MAARKINNRDQLAAFVARIGKRLQAKANREARLKARIARNTAKVDADKERMNSAGRRDDQAIEEMAIGIYAYAVQHRAELLPAGKLSAPVDTGILRWYATAESLTFSDPDKKDEATVDELQALLEAGTISQADFDEVVETKYKLMRDPLKKRVDILKRLKTACIAGGSAFAIQPANTDEKVARQTEPLRKAAVEAGLLPE